MDIIQNFRNLAREKHKTIVLPEGEEVRVIRAAKILKSENLVTPVLLGNAVRIVEQATSCQTDITGITIIEPEKSQYYNAWADEYYELRKHKNLNREQANEMLKDPLFFGAFMLRKNLADGAVAGSINTTGNVLRAAIQVVGLAENVSVVSSSFIMAFPDEKIFTFADCAVIPSPDPEQLASIAISSARSHESLVGETARVAMLSFSTRGSAQHPDTEKVVEATKIVRTQKPDLLVDGELQFDAALLKSVGDKKAPGSPVAGTANVFIFPDLDAGNIGYKIAQRLAHAEAIGPVIQGLKKPYNDLSRGCSVDDIVNVACICALLS